jgi:hypothetical protein
MKSGPVSTDVLQSLSNDRLIQREDFEFFNATVLPVSRNWETSARDYMNDPLLTKLMDATPLHMSQMWLRFDNKLFMWLREENIHDIRNNTNLETNRLMLYKQDLAKLKHGTWLGNIIIDFFIWKLLDMLIKIGMKDVYKRFKIMDKGFMHYMFLQLGRHYFDSCILWVTKREVNADGHVFLFMYHQLISVPVNMENVHWCVFVICAANCEIIVIDSLYNPRSQYHVNIYHHPVHLIQDYQKTKSLSQDKWAWHMKSITVKWQVNQDDCGVCMSLTMYCLIFGLDYRTIPPRLFNNQARLFMFYTVMGYHLNPDEDQTNNLDEGIGSITIVEYTWPSVQYNDDCNLYERQQRLRNKTNPPPLEQAHLNDLYFPNDEGVCEDSEEDESEGDDAYTDNIIIDDLEKEHEEAMPKNNKMDTKGEEGWDEEHHASDVSNLIDLRNNMHTIVQDENVQNEQKEGTENEGDDSPESIARAQRRLVDDCARIDEECEHFQKESK